MRRRARPTQARPSPDALPVPSRKRGRKDELWQYYVLFLPLLAMRSPADRAAASTGGRPTEALAADALPSGLWRHGAKVDALVRTEGSAALG